MPKPKSKTIRFKSLSEQCIHTLVGHLAKYDPEVQVDVTTSSNQFEAGEVAFASKCKVYHFNEWPLVHLEQVIEGLRANKWLNIRHRDLMLTKGTRKLDLSLVSGIQNENEVALFLELAATQCLHLTHLLIHGVKCSRKLFYKFLPLLKNVQVLDVSNTKFNDNCMHILGIHFRNLRELNIKGCHITDDGIEGLCGGPSNGGTEMPIDQRGQCKSLRILSIARHETAQVTRKGVKMAIRHLPHLKILIFEPSARNSTLAQYTAKRLDAAKVHLGKIGILSRRC